MVLRLLVPNGIAKAVCPCTPCVPTSIMAPQKHTRLTELLVSRFGFIKASCYLGERFLSKPRLLTSVATAAHVASVLKVAVLHVAVVIAAKPPQKEINNVATRS